MMADYVKRGLVSGIASGTVFGLYLFAIVSPYIEAIQGIHTEGHHSTASAILTVPSLIDVGSSTLWGILLGLIFSVFYYIFEVSIPGSKIHKPFLLAGAGFLTISGVPWILLPPSLEPVVQGLSQTARTVMYIAGMGVGAATASASIYVYNQTTDRGTAQRLALSVIPLTIVLLAGISLRVTVLQTTIPSYDWTYAAVVVIGQLSLWLVLATTFSIGIWHRQNDALLQRVTINWKSE